MTHAHTKRNPYLTNTPAEYLDKEMKILNLENGWQGIGKEQGRQLFLPSTKEKPMPTQSLEVINCPTVSISVTKQGHCDQGHIS